MMRVWTPRELTTSVTYDAEITLRSPDKVVELDDPSGDPILNPFVFWR
jgi:hypothetical protein